MVADRSHCKSHIGEVLRSSSSQCSSVTEGQNIIVYTSCLQTVRHAVITCVNCLFNLPGLQEEGFRPLLQIFEYFDQKQLC